MWLFTKYGFYSVVQAKKLQNGQPTGQLDPDTLMVRARVRSHLENLLQHFPILGPTPIHENVGTDYRYRMLVPKKRWVQVAAELTEAIDYGNFKGFCEDSELVDADYTHALHKIWGIHNGLQRR